MFLYYNAHVSDRPTQYCPSSGSPSIARGRLRCLVGKSGSTARRSLRKHPALLLVAWAAPPRELTPHHRPHKYRNSAPHTSFLVRALISKHVSLAISNLYNQCSCCVRYLKMKAITAVCSTGASVPAVSGGRVQRHRDGENAEIQMYLSKLQDLVPFMPKNRKISKLEVIQHVIDYIWDLQSALENHPAVGSFDAERALSGSQQPATPRRRPLGPRPAPNTILQHSPSQHHHHHHHTVSTTIIYQLSPTRSLTN